MATGRTRDAGGRSGAANAATIGRATRVRGRVSGDGDLTIEGAVEGDVTIGGDVTVVGAMTGDVDSRGAVRILAGARVQGNVKSDDLTLEEGAEFSGELSADFDLPSELSGGAAAASSGAARRR